MKLLHLPVLAAICVAAPGIASAVTISSAAQLASALKAAKGGETFDLAPGNYGALLIQSRRFSTPVTFRSIDPSKPAVFSGQSVVRDSSGVRFDAVSFHMPYPGTVKETGKAIALYGSSNISLSNVRAYGSLDGNPQNDGLGIYIQGSSGITVSGSNFTELHRGIGISRSTGVVISGNTIHNVRSDGVVLAQSENVKISANIIRDFMPAKGDHADGIQLWTAGTNAPSKNIEISSNLIVGKLGAQMQGIFVTDQSGGKLPYSGITIKNNTLVGTAWHGITVHHTSNASVTGNTVVTIPGSTDTTSWIMMRYVSGVMSGNTAKSFPVSDSPNLKQANNTTNTISSSLAEQAIEAWYQANLATLPDPDTIAQSPIGSNDPTVNNGFNTPTPTPDDPVLLTNSAYKMVAIDDQSVQQNDAFSQTSQQLQQTTTGSNTGTNNVLSAVPEPETWVQLVAGFGMVGWLMRRSRSGTRASVG